MQTLKDIARRMDCHPRTAKRWWRRLDWLQAIRQQPSVAPDVIGHGPHRWHDATADLLIALYEGFFKAMGTTPQIYKQKFAGKPADENQIPLPLIFHAQTSPKAPAETGRKNPAASATTARQRANAPAAGRCRQTAA